MILDFQFSIDYYLRIIELAIRDASRKLVYDRKRHLLDTWPVYKPLPEEYDANISTLQKALQELFASSSISYSISGRLLAVIEVRLREESLQTHWFYWIFRHNVYLQKKDIVEKLIMLKTLICFERERPLDKISKATSKVFAKKGNFSCWEDFSHEVQMMTPAPPLQDSVKGSLSADTESQDIIEALLTVFESHSSFLPISVELLDLFLAERAKSFQILSEHSYKLLHELQLLFISNYEDFQTIVTGIVSTSLSDSLANPIVGHQLLSPQGKIVAQFWQDSLKNSPRDVALSQSFLSEVVRRVVVKSSSLQGGVTPEQIGNIYSVRDRSLSLWTKMMRMLLTRWLLDFDREVFSMLRRSIDYYNPQPSFFRQILRCLKRNL
ncbi:hypothetical protein [Chlamydia sp. 17-3921]|uniref:hypothetical protein n=1 Tax=Chlamydia sp. 17-3921 TaxID=2675798 RepID=UPI00191A1ECD|nr:hypothetical protein [Chlamydia sp. 17-3921]